MRDGEVTHARDGGYVLNVLGVSNGASQQHHRGLLITTTVSIVSPYLSRYFLQVPADPTTTFLIRQMEKNPDKVYGGDLGTFVD